MIPNGTLVHRQYGINCETELIAQFQYFADARRFVEDLELDVPTAEVRYIATHTTGGDQFIRVFQP